MRFTSLETDAAARASISKCVLLSRPTEIITSPPGWPWLAPSLRQDFNCLLICEMAVWSSELFNLKKEKLENREIDRQEKVASLIRASRDFQQQPAQRRKRRVNESAAIQRWIPPAIRNRLLHTHTRRTDARKQLKKKKNLSTRLTFQCRATQTNLWWGVEREREKRKRNKKQKIQPNEIQEEI